MDYESIKRLGVNPGLFIADKCFELFNQDNIYHTINLYMIKESKVVCDCCQSTQIESRGTRLKKIHHSTRYETNILINLYRHVYKCRNCSSYFMQKNPFILQGDKCTHSSDVEILTELKNLSATYTAVAKRFGVSVTYVQNLFDRKVDMKRLKLPMVLAIDEVYLRKLTEHSYCCVLYDPIEKKIIDVLDSRRKDYLITYFSNIDIEERKGVFFISGDLYKEYWRITNLCFPYTGYCADSFHVVKNLNNDFNKIRIRIMKRHEVLKAEKSYYYWYFKKFWKLLLTNVKDPSKSIHIRKTGQDMTLSAIIDTMLKVDDELKEAYILKEAYREFNLTATPENCLESFDNLALAFKESKSKEFHHFYNLLITWKEPILNSFYRIGKYRISNGNLERKNSDIKTLNKNACGMSNFKRTRNRIMYCINDQASIQAERKNTTNKNVGKKRKPYKKTNKM